MAPGKPPVLLSVAKNVVTPSSSPVSLLWAHQLRREHSALLARIDDLASAVSNVSSAQLKKITTQAATAETKSTDVESEQAKLKKELQRASERGGRLENDISRLSNRLELSDRSILALQTDLRTIEEQLQKEMIDRLGGVDRKLQHDREGQERQVQALKTKLQNIQNRLPDIVRDGGNGLRDSMEEIRQRMTQIPELGLRPATHITAIDELQASGLVQPDDEPTGDMLRLRPNSYVQADPYPLGDIDLDENILTPQPDTDEVGQTLPEGTMAWLPETPLAKVPEHKDSDLLKQGKFQSWDQYLTTGEAFLVKLLRRKEVAFVEAFVDGLYDEKMRRKCEVMLDEVGWFWESIKDFVMNSPTAEMEIQARQRTESLTHKHRKGEICPICSKQVSVARSGDITNEIAKSSPRETLQQSAQRPRAAESKRRSQRIYQQSQASQLKSDYVIKPKGSKGRGAKPVEKSQIENLGILAQISGPGEAWNNVKTTEGKPAANKSEAAKSTGFGKKLATPRAEAQEKDFEVVNQDRRINYETRTTPELSRNEKRAPMQKTQSPPAATFQPVTTMHDESHESSPALPSNVLNTTTGGREVSKKESCKKRKLVEELEVRKTTKRDLVTPFDSGIRQSEVKEPDQKKRKKKAMAPIPMIPILPLSDDE